jgi:hypothetical protein
METEKSLRQRSSRRLRHEAEVKVFEKEHGSLEQIRMQLGFRPSQICELLKVHPSAWTRWTRGKQTPPPHIHQMLEWYLEILRWRGQYHPLKNTDSLSPIIRQEDPTTYVPETEPFAASPFVRADLQKRMLELQDSLEALAQGHLSGLSRLLSPKSALGRVFWFLVLGQAVFFVLFITIAIRFKLFL